MAWLGKASHGEQGWLHETRGLHAAVESWAPEQHMWDTH